MNRIQKSLESIKKSLESNQEVIEDPKHLWQEAKRIGKRLDSRKEKIIGESVVYGFKYAQEFLKGTDDYDNFISDNDISMDRVRSEVVPLASKINKYYPNKMIVETVINEIPTIITHQEYGIEYLAAFEKAYEKLQEGSLSKDEIMSELSNRLYDIMDLLSCKDTD